MFLKCFLVALVIVSAESSRTYSITGASTWSSRIRSCNNWGERVKTKEYKLPHLRTLGLKYSKLRPKTSVIAIFNSINFHTIAVAVTDLSFLMLDEYSNYEGGKEYSKTFGYVTPCASKAGCEQSAMLKLKLMFGEDGHVRAKVQTYAASWKANKHCAVTEVSIDTFQVVT